MPHTKLLTRREHTETTVAASDLHQRRALILTVTLLGAALACVMMYISVPVTMKEETYRYVIERPVLSAFFKYASAAIVGGALTAALVSYVASEVAGPEPGPFKMATIGFLYGVLMPSVTGFMVPVNLFFVRILNLSAVTTDQSLPEELLDLAFGTPRFTFFHGMASMYQGMAAGAVLFVLGWGVLSARKLTVSRILAHRPVLVSLALSLAITLLTMAGPFGVFESLVRWFART